MTLAPPTDLAFLGLGSEAAVRQLADALPDALFTTDLSGRVTYWNRAAERITGWSRSEAVGRDCSILAGDAVRGCSCGKGPLHCGLAERQRASKTCSVRTRDGRLLLIVKSAVALYAPDGSPVGTLETFAEIGSAAAGGEPAEACAAPGLAPASEAGGLVGDSAPMRELRRLVEVVARSGATVMILGESGTGKERVAEAIHAASARAAEPLVRVNCSAPNEGQLVSELFGHVKGAFPAALRDRRGRFEEADGGTLLLDEIGDLSPTVQLELLRAIEQREVARVGDATPIRVDVRLLCATHRDLKELVEAGRFRADLYFRLAVFPLLVPPLREHLEDLPAIASAFLERRVPTRTGHPRQLLPEALELLRGCSWPGNVRELQNVLEYAALQAGDADLAPEHLPAALRALAAERAPSRREMPDDREIGAALEACGGNRAAAARRLGISRVTLWKRLKAERP